MHNRNSDKKIFFFFLFFTFLFSLDSCETPSSSQSLEIPKKKDSDWKNFLFFWLRGIQYHRGRFAKLTVFGFSKLSSLRRLIRFYLSRSLFSSTSTPSWLTIAEAAQAQAEQKNWVRNFSSYFGRSLSSVCCNSFISLFYFSTRFFFLFAVFSLLTTEKKLKATGKKKKKFEYMWNFTTAQFTYVVKYVLMNRNYHLVTARVSRKLWERHAHFLYFFNYSLASLMCIDDETMRAASAAYHVVKLPKNTLEYQGAILRRWLRICQV